jgi:putative ABC transport system permease protein
MDRLFAELRHTVRTLRRQPAYTVVAVLTLALGIGATTAIYSVIQGVLLSGMPYVEADRIVAATAEKPTEDIAGVSFRVSEWRAFHEAARTLTAVGGEYAIGLTLSGDGFDAQRLDGSMVTPGFFDVFGIPPVLGRTFTMDDVEGNNLVVILSHAFWTQRLHADVGVLGRTLRLDQTPFTIVGVMPETFAPVSGAPAVYIPYNVGTEGWIGRWLALYGTMAPGADLPATTAEMNDLMGRVGAEEARSAGYTARLVSLKQLVVGDVEATLLALAGAVALVLLIATANVANLTLVRAVGRERDVSVRLALGASRRRLAREALTESLVLALLGGAAGVAVAAITLQRLVTLAPTSLPRIDAVQLDAGVLVFTMVISATVGLLFGLAPVAHTLRSTSAEQLHLRITAGNQGGGRRALGTLVAGEIAMAFVILMGAGLLLRSFGELQRTEFGFRAQQTIALHIALPRANYPEKQDRSAFFDRLIAEVRGLPGVATAAIGSNLPLAGRGSWLRTRSESGLRTGREDWPPALQRVAGPGFFQATGIPVLEGREFDRNDGADGPAVVVVNQTMARQLWPGTSAVGQRVTFRREPTDADWLEVIGVVGDVKYQKITAEPEPQVYELHAQHAWDGMYLFVSTDLPAGSIAPAVKDVVSRLDGDVPIAEVTTIAQVVDRTLAAPRFTLWLFGAFAVTALVLAAAGIYGVLSYVVSQRRRVIGIMMALGADRATVLRQVLAQGMKLLAVGAVVGGLLALAGGRALAGLLYRVQPADTVTFAAVATVLGLVVVAACLAPSVRASRVDPIEVLRDE